MRRLIAWLVAAAVLGCGIAHAATVEIRDAVARVTVIPEARDDVQVSFLRSHPRLPVAVRTAEDGRVIVDGGLRRRIRSCRAASQASSVVVAGVGEVGWDQMPQIVIRTPLAVDLAAGGAVFGVVGRSAKVDLVSAGCGDWTVADVEGALTLTQAGSARTRAGRAATAHVRVAGAGGVTTARVDGPVRVEVAGAGDVSVAGVKGPLDVRVTGSGDVSVASGRASPMTVSISGSGDVSFAGVADRLKARIAGSGDVRAFRVEGQVETRVIGSGAVRIG